MRADASNLQNPPTLEYLEKVYSQIFTEYQNILLHVPEIIHYVKYAVIYSAEMEKPFQNSTKNFVDIHLIYVNTAKLWVEMATTANIFPTREQTMELLEKSRKNFDDFANYLDIVHKLYQRENAPPYDPGNPMQSILNLYPLSSIQGGNENKTIQEEKMESVQGGENMDSVQSVEGGVVEGGEGRNRLTNALTGAAIGGLITGDTRGAALGGLIGAIAGGAKAKKTSSRSKKTKSRSKRISKRRRSPSMTQRSGRFWSPEKTYLHKGYVTSLRGKKTLHVYTPSQQKKYNLRKSPALPANKYCGKTARGNDGHLWESKMNKRGVCAWKRV